MTLHAVIFDLDLTLIASSAAERLRKERLWQDVYRLIPQLTPYVGIDELLGALSDRGVKTAIVTSSPSTYCRRVIAHWRWQIDATVCYHDTTEKKPHPAPMLKALEYLGVRATDTIAIGDHANDIISARSAKVFSVGALWDCANPDDLNRANPDLVCASVEAFVQHLKSKW